MVEMFLLSLCVLLQVVPIIDGTAKAAIGNHAVDKDGYIQIPHALFEGKSDILKHLQVLHFADKPINKQKRSKPVDDSDTVCMPIKKRKNADNPAAHTRDAKSTFIFVCIYCLINRSQNVCCSYL